MRPWILLAPVVCGLATASCASRSLNLPDAPRVGMPAEARAPCALYRLPDAPTEADLEIGYATRGAQLAACDAARRLAVDTHDREHALEDEAHGKRRSGGGP